MPAISVIMPAYNAEKYIKEAIDSILMQTFTNFELLICDDGSTDKTYEIIKTYKDPRVKIYQNKKNIGNLQTTNFLFSQCCGDYIGIQDADDYSSADRFEELISKFRENPELGLVGSNYGVVDQNANLNSCSLLPLDDKEIRKMEGKESPPILYASILVKRETLNKVGLFREFFNRKGYADIDWLMRISENTLVANSKKILYYYRKHDQSFNYFFYNKMRRNAILKNMHVLLLDAQKIRKNGKIDYFETADTKSMKEHIIFNKIRSAENLFWDNKTSQSYMFLFEAFQINPINMYIYKTFFYIFRKSLTKRRTI